MNSIVYSYAKMINDNICTISQIPEEYRDEVTRYMESGDGSPNAPAVEDGPNIYGALYLYPITDVIDTSILGNGGTVSIEFENADIFTIQEIGSNPAPTDITYEIIRVENAYGKFKTTPSVELVNSGSGVEIRISGTPRNIVPDSTILRIDLKIISSNYEDMRITIYIDAE